MKKGVFQVKQLFTIFACCLFCAASVFAGPGDFYPTDTTPVDTLPGANITIRFFDRTIYYPGDSPSEPIMVQITIANESPQTLHFKLADDHFFSVDFKACNTRNIQLEHTDNWMRKRSTNRQVYFRELSIEPGEAYSFNENIKDYLSVVNPGIYLIDCSFYPELKRNSDDSEPAIHSNRLTLEVKPSPGAAAVKLLPVSPVNAEVLQAEPIPPDQVITYLLTARQKSHWDQFFLYLDLEQMISRDPARSRRFRAESESGRMTMIDNYKSELSQSKLNEQISTIPVEFQIEKTTYSATDGSVTVLEWFAYRTFWEKKRFTYYLSCRDGIWRIKDYTVDNLGTEDKRN